MILSLVFYIFLAYMLYRLIFGFIIPLVRTTRRVKKSFREMQERMQGQYGTQPGPQAYGQQAATAPKSSGSTDEDYIEFEEVK